MAAPAGPPKDSPAARPSIVGRRGAAKWLTASRIPLQSLPERHSGRGIMKRRAAACRSSQQARHLISTNRVGAKHPPYVTRSSAKSVGRVNRPDTLSSQTYFTRSSAKRRAATAAAAPAVLISRSPAGGGKRCRLEEAVIRGLAQQGVRALVVPHIYYLRPPDEPARQLVMFLSGAAPAGRRTKATVGKGRRQRVVVASWLYPRAARWTLAALGAPADGVSALDFRDYRAAGECLKALLAHAGAASGGRAEAQELTGAPAARWYPVIDYERCRNCRQCLEFCLFGVYSLGRDGRVRATRPDECKPGCPACARVCPAGAIMFPHYEDAQIAGGAVPRAARRKAAPSKKGRAAPGRARRRKGDELDGLINALEKLDDS